METNNNDGHPDYPISDWQFEAKNGDTRLGYQEWLRHKLESESDDVFMDQLMKEGVLKGSITLPPRKR